MKSILLKLDDKEFFKLQNVKTRAELAKRESMTWEKFISLLRKNWEYLKI